MQKRLLKKKEPDLCHSCLQKGSLCKLLKHKLVASPHLPQHVSGTGTNVQLSEEKEREREREMQISVEILEEEKRSQINSYTFFLVPLQFFWG